MKNSQKGFIVPLVITLVALVIGGGAYFYFKSTQSPQIDRIQTHVSSQNTPAEQTINQARPVISLISPASTTPQSLVTITGSGFVGNNDIKFTSMSQSAIVAYACGARAKNNNTSILFGSGPSFQDPLVSDCNGGLGVKGIVLQPGLYEVSVINNNGISNSVSYTISSPVAQVDETAGWKTYVSQKLGFSFEYPTEWGTVAEEIIDYAGGQNQAGGYVADAGKGYSLIFSLISNVSYEYRIYGVGQSADFVAGREFIPTDYKGDPKRSVGVISEIGINLTASCSESGFPVGPPTSHAIKFNLPGKEISGVMLVFPVLSVSDTQKYNQLLDDFIKKEISCSDMWEDNAGGEKAKQIMAKLVAKEFEISEMLRTGENFDKESQVNLMIYNRILKSAKILQQ